MANLHLVIYLFAYFIFLTWQALARQRRAGEELRWAELRDCRWDAGKPILPVIPGEARNISSI
jgi:hypothetical protein